MMHKAIYLLTVCLLVSTPAYSQASRTWVSGIGDDANPCSRTAPCKTFAGAISKTATGGEINALDPGGYGAVTITKSIAIDVSGTLAGITSSGVNGIIVNLSSASDSVVLRGLDIQNSVTSPSGIRVIGSGSVVVDNVTINQGMKGIDFQPTGNARLIVTNTIITNTDGGALIKPNGVSTVATFDGVTFAKNIFGIRAEDRSNVFVRNSNATGNVNNGFLALSVSQPVQMNIVHSSASANQNGGTSSGIQSNGAQTVVRISDVSVVDNDIGLNIVGGATIASWNNNQIGGNLSSFSPTTVLSQQ